MDLEIWLKIHTNASNFEKASPKPYKLLKFFISFVTTVKSCHAPTIWKKMRWKSLFSHFKEYHGNHKFILKASYFVKWPISTWSFMRWCQFIDCFKFETRPSFLMNFGTANWACTPCGPPPLPQGQSREDSHWCSVLLQVIHLICVFCKHGFINNSILSNSPQVIAFC